MDSRGVAWEGVAVLRASTKTKARAAVKAMSFFAVIMGILLFVGYVASPVGKYIPPLL
jgi:hypothetical protein